jgi:hypothetical protein
VNTVSECEAKDQSDYNFHGEGRAGSESRGLFIPEITPSRPQSIGQCRYNFLFSLLVLLSQKVVTNDEENHLFGKIHTSAMGGWNESAKIE